MEAHGSSICSTSSTSATQSWRTGESSATGRVSGRTLDKTTTTEEFMKPIH